MKHEDEILAAVLVTGGALALSSSWIIEQVERSGLLTPSFTIDVATKNNSASHQYARPILLEAFTRKMGRAPSLAELQYAHAIAYLETRYGKGWKDQMDGSNNWGAVQCREGSTLPCIEWEDSHPDGTKYPQRFRAYDSPVEGAIDVINNVFTIRPKTKSALSDAKATTYRASYAMRREKYYGGFCPNATSTHGKESARASFGTPDRDGATRACAEESITTHAKLAHSIMRDVAGAMGEPVAIPLGTFKDADGWYRKRYVKSALVAGVSGIAEETTSFLRRLARSALRFSGILSPRRRAALEAIASVVPSTFGAADGKFARLASGYSLDILDTHPTFTTCGYLPLFVLRTLGIKGPIASGGLTGLRDEARKLGAWRTVEKDGLPFPGDLFALEKTPGGGIVHVGAVRAANGSTWETSDAGQGTVREQQAKNVSRSYDAASNTVSSGNQRRYVAGYVDIDAL